MPRFLDTLGNSDIAIAVCDRCKMKRAHSVMRSDPNFPGLQVCNTFLSTQQNNDTPENNGNLDILVPSPE
jgi:hypothetical protein